MKFAYSVKYVFLASLRKLGKTHNDLEKKIDLEKIGAGFEKISCLLLGNISWDPLYMGPDLGKI